ncbi:MAG: DUF1194 domain-containing protein [Rhizobiaceae bacterium]
MSSRDIAKIRRLDEYFKVHFISGADAFVVNALGYEDFADAIRLKLLREFAHLHNS